MLTEADAALEAVESRAPSRAGTIKASWSGRAAHSRPWRGSCPSSWKVPPVRLQLHVSNRRGMCERRT